MIEKEVIHSYRYRTKDGERLVEKVIRKRNDNFLKDEQMNSSNDYKFITDLIGIRVSFLYKEDWLRFHEYITGLFENKAENYIKSGIEDFDDNFGHHYIVEKPKVYERNGDSDRYDRKLIDIKDDGIYRSLHYIIKYKGYHIEIRARTLFEEG